MEDFEAIINFVGEAIFVKDDRHRYIVANNAFCEMIGFPRERVLGRTDYEFFPEAQADVFWKQDDHVFETGDEDVKEEQFVNIKGDIRAVVSKKTLYTSTAGEKYIVGTIRDFPELKRKKEALFESEKKYRLGTVFDITEQKTTQTELQKSEERLRSLIDSVPFGAHLYEMDADDRLVFRGYNKSADRILRIDNAQFIGKPIEEAFPPLIETEIPASYKRVAMTGQGFETEQVNYSHQQIQGAYQVHAFQTAPRWMAAFFIDITERKQAEEEKAKLQAQLNQAQKMESIGRLAGGVAHDFNNILTVILGYSQLAMMRCNSSDPIYEDLEVIENSAIRSSNLVRQLLAFARKQTVAPKILNLNDIVSGMLKMLQRLIGEDIDFNWFPGADLWRIKMDPSQVDQLLANLCVNARDAITGVGKITIETENISVAEANCDAHANPPPGDYVMLAVSDDGCGISKDDIDHIFEPFFTTKETGKGIGLGLATVYGIVEQNKGSIALYSEPGKRTTFRIYLPRFVGETLESYASDKTEIHKGSGELVLLVEDEEANLNLSKKMLEMLGYVALTAGTPGEALRLAEIHGNQIRLLLTDVVMPEMNGKDLAKLLYEKIPGMKCLFTSGYTSDVIAHRGILEEGIHFLQKPYSVKDLAAKMCEALEQG
jgi:PAS domain S-box-containing protein